MKEMMSIRDRMLLEQKIRAVSSGKMLLVTGDRTKDLSWIVGSVPEETAVYVIKVSASHSSDDESALKMAVLNAAVENGPFDFIFIDGMSIVNGMLTGLDCVIRYLRPGGIIAIDGLADLRHELAIRRSIYHLLSRSKELILSREMSRISDLAFLQRYQSDGDDYPLDEVYDEAFYKQCIQMHKKSISELARSIYERYAPESVIDFGCGAGMWLKEFVALGVKEAVGIDGSSSAINESGNLENVSIIRHDLRQRWKAPHKYDLCLCLDVIEHLEPVYDENLIWSCVNASDTIVFSSPPPGQGGEMHLNERPISYWVEKFFRYGYILMDTLRPNFDSLSVTEKNTYHMNLYIAKKAIDQHETRGINLNHDKLLEILKKKEERIEDLYLQNYLARKQLEDFFELKDVFRNAVMVEFVISPERIEKEKGHCFVYKFRSNAARIYTRLPVYRESILYEDHKPLSNENAIHDEIRQYGSGRYSFWHEQVYFSSSDNSDPRTNSRTYSIKVPSYIYFLENLPEEQIERLGI